MLIRFKDIIKSYVVGTQTLTVLKRVSLDIEEGEFVAIMGPSGSGKSTLMNIIGLLDNPTSGEYLLEGRDVATISGDEQSRIRGRRIGFVFQSYNLIPRLTVLKQVILPLMYQGISGRERERRAREALDKVGLAKFADNRPSELSGGQQQRVSIARALVVNPAIILADEPTGALDTKTSDEIMQIFDGLHSEGKTIIMITHSPEIATFAKRQIHIRDGNIVL